jgi:hypothetical protein
MQTRGRPSLDDHEKAKSIARQRAYYRWNNMMRRCYNENHPKYAAYGGRGISVYKPWHNFDLWYLSMGDPPGPGFSMDRKDNNQGYFPGNVQWADDVTQRRNSRGGRKPVLHSSKRHAHARTKIVDSNGVEYTSAEAAGYLGCKMDTLRKRLKHLRAKAGGQLLSVDLDELKVRSEKFTPKGNT